MIDNLVFHNCPSFETEEKNNKIHIRIKQRNGRKSVTTVENLPPELNIETISKNMKKCFHCISTVIKSGDEKIIQLSGDQRTVVKKYLVDNQISVDELIVVHGY